MQDRQPQTPKDQCSGAGADPADAAGTHGRVVAQQQASLILESITDAFYALDREWRFTYINQRALDYFGRGRDELVGQVFWDAFPMIRGSEIERHYRRASQEQTTLLFEALSPFSGKWVEERVHPSPEEGLSVYFRDISVRKAAQIASDVLAHAGKILSLSLDYESTLEEVARLVVPKFADWCAIDLVDDEGAGILRRVAVVHSDPAKVQLARELQLNHPPKMDAPHGVARVLRTGQPDWAANITDELLAAGTDDPETLRIVRGLQLRSFIAVPLSARGRTLGVLTLVHAESGRTYVQADVEVAEELGRRAGAAVDNARLLQSLREGEERKSAILESSLDCLVTMDAQGCIVDFNPVAERTFGYSRQEAIGQFVADLLVPPRLREQHLNGLNRYLQTGEAVVLGRRLEMPALRADGTEIPIELAISVVRMEGRAPFFTAFLRDITERKRSEEQREQLLEAERAAREEAERVARMKDEFLATLSHELRTPLNAILGWSQLINRSTTSAEELASGLETIERNARAQAQLIEDLLDMSRIVSGKLNLEVGVVQPADFVQAAIESVRHAAEAKGIRLTAMFQPGAGTVRGDANRLQQIVWNLLSNAIKFTTRGGRIQVCVRRADSRVEIIVSDNGQGITPDFLPHVFDRFRQADSATTRRHGGLGLGLSIVKQLVELHGGTVAAASDGLGTGATFTVQLPLLIMHQASESSSSGADLARRSIEQAYESAPLRGVTVLMVDDEADTRDLVRRVLEKCQASVLLASSAQQALELIARQRPDIILSDIGMPDTDGYELLRRIRSLPASEGGRIPAVALTALARSEDRRRALLAGFQVHVAKPLEAGELIAAVASLVKVTGEPRP